MHLSIFSFLRATIPRVCVRRRPIPYVLLHVNYSSTYLCAANRAAVPNTASPKHSPLRFYPRRSLARWRW